MTQSASTRAVGGVAIVLLSLVIVPGRLNNHGAFTAAPLAFEHGWPLVWLDREIDANVVLPTARIVAPPLLRGAYNWRASVGRPGLLAAQSLIEWAKPVAVRRAWGAEHVSAEPTFSRRPAWMKIQHWPFAGAWHLRWVGVWCDIIVWWTGTTLAMCAWKLGRPRIRQFTLRTLLFTIIAAAIVLAIAASRTASRRGTAQEPEVYRCWAPVWLRMLVGEPAVLCSVDEVPS